MLLDVRTSASKTWLQDCDLLRGGNHCKVFCMSMGTGVFVFLFYGEALPLSSEYCWAPLVSPGGFTFVLTIGLTYSCCLLSLDRQVARPSAPVFGSSASQLSAGCGLWYC